MVKLRDWADEISTLVLMLMVTGLLLWAGGIFDRVRADVPHPSIAHPGSMVVFVHYMPPYEGDQRAAMILEHPRACPPDTPNGMTDCANLRFWTVKPSEIENPTNVLDEAGQPTGDHTNNGDDWRCCVPHDPTGKFPRSWHLWGEAPGEEDQ